MSKQPKDDGGQAFPFVEQIPDGYGGTTNTVYFGASLRDYFAAKVAPHVEWYSSTGLDRTDIAAAECYKRADAMIKARDL